MAGGDLGLDLLVGQIEILQLGRVAAEELLVAPGVAGEWVNRGYDGGTAEDATGCDVAQASAGGAVTHHDARRIGDDQRRAE